MIALRRMADSISMNNVSMNNVSMNNVSKNNAPMNRVLGNNPFINGPTWRIARKELTVFFASPLAYLFFASFIAVTLFVFFWLEAFFPRNIADVRPMFEWLPVLLVFLCAALTMRMWSEENRLGTLELIMTVSATPLSFIIGKFYACVILLVIALLLTLPLPLSVSLIASLDWGPVIAAYVATILLGSAYMAIGLFVSALNDNQIVSLIITTCICALLYLLGSDVVTALFGPQMSGLLHFIGSGARFESISRGVLDFRDLYYYLSLVIAFLALTAYSLESLRWANEGNRARHWGWRNLTLLVVGNVLLANVWLASTTTWRVDLTAGKIYSISDITKRYLSELREPLLIRGYFSTNTHPLLAPLVPQMKDLIAEYQITGGGRVQTEFVDPTVNEDIEEEANTKYGILPVPMQVADRYQASLVNAYFNVVIQYGDQFEVLDFDDLIDIKVQPEGNPDVALRNPEYDITRSIKRVLYDYQLAGQLFDGIHEPLTLTVYLSAQERLPASLVQFKAELQQVVTQIQTTAAEKFTVEYIDPDRDDGSVAKDIKQKHGFLPINTGLFGQSPFYFHMVLANAEKTVNIPLPESLRGIAFEQTLEAAIKKFSPGLVQTVGAVAPSPQTSGDDSYEYLHKLLNNNLNVTTVDLTDGAVPTAIDVLLIIAPEKINAQALYAIDQFLMQGGTVVLATSPFSVTHGAENITANPHDSGMTDWLAHFGITLPAQLVMDNKNVPFPLPVERHIRGVPRRELRLVDYPYFIDIRGNGVNGESSITRGLDQIIMAWSSPLVIDREKNSARAAIPLLQSSNTSWSNGSFDIAPSDAVFSSHGEPGPHIVAASFAGVFDSYFADKAIPVKQEERLSLSNVVVKPESITETLVRSPESARLVLFASNEFLTDQTSQINGRSQGTRYQKPLELVVNAVEWSLQDQGLAAIRGRSHFARTLPPLERQQQQLLEYLNYTVAVVGILFVLFVQRTQHNKRLKRLVATLMVEDKPVAGNRSVTGDDAKQ